MSNKKADLKARLLAETEKALEKMLSDERMSQEMTLSEIENVIGELENDFRQRVLREVMSEQAEQAITCPDCGGQLRKKGKHSKRLVTLRGETNIERSYYQCETCGKGIFPP